MAINATSAPKIRAKNTQTLQHADGTTSEIRWIKEATAIKRLRRHLAKSGCTLHVTREGSSARHQHGEYFITEEDGRQVDDKINLESWLRAYDLLADDEKIDPPLNRGWRYYIGRTERVMVDGISANYARPITRTYTSEAAARRAVEHLTDREGLVICSFDASIREAP